MANIYLLHSQARAVAPAQKAALRQARGYADKAAPTEVSSILEQRIRGVSEEASLAETGRVLSVGYVKISKTLEARCESTVKMKRSGS